MSSGPHAGTLALATLAGVLVLVPAAVVGGGTTADDVPMFRGDAARTGRHPGPGPAGMPDLRWRIRLGYVISSSPAVVDEVVYVGTMIPGAIEGGALHAVDARTGVERWRVLGDAGDGFYSSPAVDDGTIVIGSLYGDVLAVSADGELAWRVPATGPVIGSPLLIDGSVYIGDTAGTVLALDAETGRTRWSVATDRPNERAIGSLSAAAGIIYGISAPRRTTAIPSSMPGMR